MSHQDLIQELQDIKKYSQLILDHTAEMSFDDYMEDMLTRLAVERSIMIIGEASARIRYSHPDVFERIEALRLAIGVRNRLAHGYDEQISDESIWSIVEVGLPALLKEIERVDSVDFRSQ